VHPGGDQSGDVGHVHHQQGIDGMGNLRQSAEIEKPRIGAGTGHDHFRGRCCLASRATGVVDGFRLPVDAIVDKIEKPPGKADFGAVGQVAAVGQVHAQHRIARFQQGKIGRHVGLGSRVRLHVGAYRHRKGSGPVDGQLFGPVDELTPTVVTLFGVAFGVLVGQICCPGPP
jgi:hypothetical protein